MKQIEWLLTLDDLLFFLKKKKKRLLIAMATFTLVSLLFVIYMTTPSYLATGVFQDSAISSSEEQLKYLKKMIPPSPSSARQGKALLWMSASPLLKQVIEKNSLRLSFAKGVVLSWQHHFNHSKVDHQRGLLERIQDFKAPDEMQSKLTLQVRDPHHLEVILKSGEKSVCQVPGKCTIGPCEFYIESSFPQEWKGLALCVNIQSYSQTLLKCKKRLSLLSSKIDTNVVYLSFSHPVAEIAKKTVNSVMQSYQAFLQSELEEKIQQQVNLLTQRHNELWDELKVSMDGHVDLFQQTLQEHGVMKTEDWLSRQLALERSLDQQIKSIDLLIDEQKHILSDAQKEKLSQTHPLLSLDEGKALLTTTTDLIEQKRQMLSQMDYFHTHIFDPKFDLSSLMTHLEPTLVRKALLLSNESQNSVKKELKQHIEKKITLIRSDLESLSQRRYELVQTFLGALKEQKKFLNGKATDIGVERKKIPDQWMSEMLLQLKSDLNYATVQALSQLVESTMIKQYMDRVEAKVMEWGFSTNKRISLHPIALTLGMAFALFFVTLVGMIMVQLYRGFPISEATLRRVSDRVVNRYSELEFYLKGGREMAFFSSNLEKWSLFFKNRKNIHVVKANLCHLLDEVSPSLNENQKVVYLLDKKECMQSIKHFDQRFDRLFIEIEEESYSQIVPLLSKEGCIFWYG